MCGIAGIVSGRPIAAGVPRAMADTLVHRGPDDEGIWLSENRQVALVQRRLAIVDLSPAGHQPMESADGRWVLNLNGEIYNHRELRAELEAAGGAPAGGWRGHSDTETFLEAIARWGFRPALDKAAGMFAISLWDRESRELHLARDRFGEKPLYYGWCGGAFLFGSELKALKAWPGFDAPVSRDALALLLARTYVPAPLSIYEGVFKLQPGCVLTVAPEVWRHPLKSAPEPGDRHEALRIERYYSYLEVVRAGLDRPISNEAQALEELELALARAIRGQSVADVPVGAFLSGGIDSSTIVAMYRKHGAGAVRTYTVGFEEAEFDEAPFAREVARHLGTEHHETTVTVREALEVIPLLPSIYDEPFADSSQIPTYLISRFARREVTVALSGDAGDELFGGYNRYLGAARLWSAMRRLPAPLRRSAGQALGRVPAAHYRRLIDAVSGRKRSPHLGTKVQKAFRTMASARGIEDVYSSFIDEWHGMPSPVLGAGRSLGIPRLDVLGGAPDTVKMMYADTVGSLPDDMLCKVDRVAMAVSLETRAPFLDHRVADVAARIPVTMKIGGGAGKAILRQLLYREAPRRLFERPKTGFGIPVGQWLRGPLRGWAEELLDPRRLAADAYLDPAPIRRRWDEHLSGRIDATQSLWAVLMFQSWLAEERASCGRRAA